ncbi:RNA polymerase sigma factor [Saccharibacillus alkalitolerans]|uniref:RNA polymerase sigma factor n=1 Tax=Saccharibacillus alkalitolerans TaxID=2705290 RepID=A0ABX0F328_9BACL|nr:RNA polymerase sigma factor [Saccharibacillus alkalitolerans]NGZ75397.1 RNA polymerase sigma factor [Saccharibacillus alkalitolerans]
MAETKTGRAEFGIEQNGQKEERQSASNRARFDELISEHGEALKKYCRFLTGSSPDGEDLLQETWLKAWSAFRGGGKTWNRTYLRSVAYHAWIDRMRRGREETGLEAEAEAAAESPDPLKLWPAADRLVRVLTPDQRTAYLLMEYLRFTAAETAELLRTTEGGVKAALHRARKKLDEYRQEESETKAAPDGRETASGTEDEQTVYAYMEAIRLQDVRALLILRNGGSGEEAVLAVRCAAAPKPGRTERPGRRPYSCRGGRTDASSLPPFLLFSAA